MKEYSNGMKATEISKKQISVIYRNAKLGNLKLEKWVANDLYEMADYYGYDNNGNIELCERYINAILKAVFGNDFVEAQKEIDRYTEFWMPVGKQAQNINRNYVA